MKHIAELGRGIIVRIREPLTILLSEQRRCADEPIAPAGQEPHDYG
ncbi:hypothetical protein [Bradyrhizobium sp. 143]|nr:hypothetical protein [Bradyrhizobium sp. 143]MCK1709581.1 hypothetical protein [Bradyrhizobium sp. 143]